MTKLFVGMVFLTDVSLRIKSQILRFFRCNATAIFDNVKEDSLKEFLDYITSELKVDGVTISPGFAYERAPDQQHFAKRSNTKKFFGMFLSPKTLKMGFLVIQDYT